MNETIKNTINDVRVAIKRYQVGYSVCSSRGTIIRYAKKLTETPNIENLLNEFNTISSDKIDVPEAIRYITEAKEKIAIKSINRDSHPILKMFDEVLEEHSNRLREETEKHFNGLRNKFIEANKVEKIGSYTYAKNEAIKDLNKQFPTWSTKPEKEKESFIIIRIKENPVYQLIQTLGFPYTDDIKWNEWLNKTIEETVRANKSKLYSTVMNKLKNLTIQNIEKVYIRTGVQGFEGTFNITVNNEIKFFTVKSIYAGGYNIQCLHYRFLAKVK